MDRFDQAFTPRTRPLTKEERVYADFGNTPKKSNGRVRRYRRRMHRAHQLVWFAALCLTSLGLLLLATRGLQDSPI